MGSMLLILSLLLLASLLCYRNYPTFSSTPDVASIPTGIPVVSGNVVGAFPAVFCVPVPVYPLTFESFSAFTDIISR